MEKIIRACLPTYEIRERIGQGVYGSVYRVRDRFKERAVKVVPIVVERSLSCQTTAELDSKVSQDFHAVEAYYEKIRGPGVVEVYDFHLVDKEVTDRQAQAHLVILMQLCSENLRDFVLDRHPLSPDSAKALMVSLAGALRRLSMEVVDVFVLTDLKPGNLLIGSDGGLLIGDLGGLKRLGTMTTAANTQFSLNWCAPEFILQGARPDIRSAVFSFGLVAYYIWEGCLPHEEDDFIERVRKFKEGPVAFCREDIPDPIRSLIVQCLTHDPKERPADFDALLRRLTADPSIGRTRAAAAPSSPEPVHESRSDAFGTGRQDRIDLPPGRRVTTVAPGAAWTDPSLGLRFVWVPDGQFRPGDPWGQSPSADPVGLAGFWMGTFPVTQGEWQRVMGVNPAHFQGGADLPVEQVSYDDAMDFVRKLIRLTLRRYRFALPTEDQWEYAARSGGRKQAYAGGDIADLVAWHRGNSGLATHPVGLRQPNALGLFDMSGNVMEWCGDGQVPDVDGTQRETVAYDRAGARRPARGGSCNAPPEACRTWVRRLVNSALGYSTLGLRLIRLP
ncbi:MAG: SUMF1/EgtB/PvdO family nonheme iron enzyme [Desulfobacterales bacterium]|nr:SUMF1/EgtB/PvdO family nonheme iron enzyme [Desulfobacterales bacterium]